MCVVWKRGWTRFWIFITASFQENFYENLCKSWRLTGNWCIVVIMTSVFIYNYTSVHMLFAFAWSHWVHLLMIIYWFMLRMFDVPIAAVRSSWSSSLFGNQQHKLLSSFRLYWIKKMHTLVPHVTSPCNNYLSVSGASVHHVFIDFFSVELYISSP